MSNFERKYGRYAIPNLSLIMVICYGVGYLLQLLAPSILTYLELNPWLIIHGQIWRLITWILVPINQFQLLDIIMLLFYYSIGRSLERVWGDYKYNLYILSGILITVLGSFVMMGIVKVMPSYQGYPLETYMSAYAQCFSAYFIYMSIFLAFAATFPENRVLLMFIIPIKVKWLGIAYSIYFLYEIISYPLPYKFVIGASLVNFLIFFLAEVNRRKGSPKARVQQAQRKYQFEKDVKTYTSTGNIAKHKCAICGRTENDNPDLQFRFCSKCNGNYEYCNDHLFNHKHVE